MAASLPPALFIGKVKLPDRSLFEQQILTLASAAKRPSVYKERESTAALRVLTARYIVQGLYHTYASLNSGLSLSIPHTQRTYAADARLSIFSYRMMVDVTDAIIKLGWAKVSKGYVRNDGSHVLSTYKATGDLLQAFEKCGIVWQRLVHRKNERTIFLRIKIKEKILIDDVLKTITHVELLPTPNTPEVKQMRANLKRINDHISSQAICLHLRNDSLRSMVKTMSSRNYVSISFFGVPRKKGRHMNFYDCLLHRVFSNGSMTQGGRFYGGWWQSIPSKYRPFITINGARTHEIDFSEFHIRLLYDQAGITPPQGDLYNFADVQSLDKSVRSIHKQFLNAYLNDLMGKHRLNKSEERTLGMTTTQLHTLMISKHPNIVQWRGAGLHLQYLDSQIAEAVMLELLEEGITVLPVHDSFLVDAMHTDRLAQAMNNAYSRAAKGFAQFKFDVEGKRSEFILPFNDKNEVDLEAMVRMHRESIHDAYVSSWEESTSGKGGDQEPARIVNQIRHLI